MIKLKPIATVKNSRTKISDDHWGGVISEIILKKDLSEEVFLGIGSYSHLEIIFYFDRVKDADILRTSGHPREDKNFPLMGIFAQRKKNRPNKIGHTVVELVEHKGRSLFVKELDAIDGTPVLDIKPVVKEFLPKAEIRQPKWVSEMMKDYWKEK